MSPSAKMSSSAYYKSIYEIMEDCCLTLDEEYDFKKHIESLGKEYLGTPFSSKAAEILGDMNVSAFKIGSGECSNDAVLVPQQSTGNH